MSYFWLKYTHNNYTNIGYFLHCCCIIQNLRKSMLNGSSIWSLKDTVSLMFGEQTIQGNGTCLAHLWLLEVFFQTRFFIDFQTACAARLCEGRDFSMPKLAGWKRPSTSVARACSWTILKEGGCCPKFILLVLYISRSNAQVPWRE